MFVKVDTTAEDNRYWTRKRYCFKCKRVRLFYRCDNCGQFFCPECSGEWQDPELGDYGSIFTPAYMAHTKC